METILWICQGLLAFIFMFSGLNKAFLPEQKLVASGQTGVEGLHWLLIKFIGISEILGAIGVIVPWLIGIAPILTPISATGFCIIMLLAAPIHYKRKELRNVFINFVIFLISAFVAFQRFNHL